MKKNEDKNTRYYIDVNLKTQKIINWDYDQKQNIAIVNDDVSKHRVFLTKGQYKKLINNLEK